MEEVFSSSLRSARRDCIVQGAWQAGQVSGRRRRAAEAPRAAQEASKQASKRELGATSFEAQAAAAAEAAMAAGKHQAKVLNLGLIIYIALGGLIFYSIGEHESPGEQEPGSSGGAPGASGANQTLAGARIERLRAQSVRRMWNITNQLNILYESNWTELVLAELVEFEQRLVDSLERQSSGTQAPEASRQSEPERGDGRARELEASRRRVETLKRALVHALATITTMGKCRAGWSERERESEKIGPLSRSSASPIGAQQTHGLLLLLLRAA